MPSTSERSLSRLRWHTAEIRTKEFVVLDWNPTNEFWSYTEVKDKRTDVEELTLTYKDHEA
jgi:phage terminase large subunit